jgi:transmembrane sensor
VILGPSSEVVVPAGFAGDRRQVELRGVAYFDVVHDDRSPFTVLAHGATVQDVGTRFTVQSGDAGVRVVVAEGAVLLTPPRSGTGVMLQAGDVGVAAAGRDSAMRSGALTDGDLAWLEGRIVLDDAPMSRVQEEMRRWYGLVLVVDSTLGSRRLTLALEADAPERAVQTIALALGASGTVRGDTVVIGAPR